MIDLEAKAKSLEKLELKRREIVFLFKKGMLQRELATKYKMSIRGIAELLKVCIAYGFISEKEYNSCIKEHSGSRNLKRGKK